MGHRIGNLAIEAKRGCGYRKAGGIYLVGEGIAIGCHRLPLPMHVCPTCNQGIKPALGFTWISPKNLFGDCNAESKISYPSEKFSDHNELNCHKVGCKICFPPEKAGLLWVGNRFYKTPEEFTLEAGALGVSKRIGAVPHGLQIGEFILLGHRKAIKLEALDADGHKVDTFHPGLFYGFHVRRMEIIITQTQSQDPEFMESIKKRNLTPVIVPDDDPDHMGTVYDKKREDENDE